MKKLNLLLGALLLVVSVQGRAETVGVDAPSAYEPKIIVSDHEKIIIELTAPPITVKPVNTPGARGQMIMMSGYSQTAEPGAPQLPVQGYVIAVPANAKPSLQLLEQDTEMRNLGDIPPAPRIVYERDDSRPDEPKARYTWDRDSKIYSRNDFYPSAPVQITEAGIMRDLRMVTVQIHPVLFNPVQNRVRYAKKLRFAVYFNGSTNNNWSERNAAKSFEDIFKSTVLNYEQSKKFRVGRSAGLQKTGADDYFLSQGSEWYKLLLEKPGIYYVTRADLEAAGMNLTGVDPRKFRMFNKGVEIAINVIGESDGSFDAGDQIEFYGTAFKNYYTTTNVYWLTVGSVNGKRMQVKDGSITGSYPVLTRGRERHHQERDAGRRADFPGHTDAERWFMAPVLAPNTYTTNVTLNNISPVTVNDDLFRLVGRGTSAHDLTNPDHHTIVKINGTQIYDHFWDGRIYYEKSEYFEQAVLVNGTNQIQVIGPGDTGASADQLYIDYFQIEYWRDYVAQQDTIAFNAEGESERIIELSGFTQGNLKLFEIVDSTNVKLITNFENPTNGLRFQDNPSGKKRYLALAESKRRKPSSLFKDSPSTLRSGSNRADYLVITFEDFYESSRRLADHREAQGLTTQVIKIQDIYDEFNFGFYEEKALKSFFAYCYQNWSAPLPTFAVLVGDASWNPRILNPGSFGSERSDFVPSRLFESAVDNFEAASDNWFGAVQGSDPLPEFFIGRIPARTAVQAGVMIDKIINYETDFMAGEWNNTVTFVADNNEDGVMAFEDSSDAFIRDLVPPNFIKKKAYHVKSGDPAVTKALINDAINIGTLILNYYGHGSISSWGQEFFYLKSDVPLLRNDNKAPFALTLSCINGYFVNPKDTDHALAEAFIRERQRGAVSVFSGAGEAYPSPVLTLGRELYRTLFKDHAVETGSFTYAGLVKMYARYPSYPDHVMFYILFGDPATKLHYQPAQRVVTAGYEGAMALNAGWAPPGTGVLALIDGGVLASDFVRDKGAFGPLYVGADDPNTAIKEGGAPGDSVTFKAVVGADTLTLHPRYAWKPGEVQTVQLSSGVVGIAGVEVAFYADDKQFGRDLIDGDYVAKNAVLSVVMTPKQGALDAAAPVLSLNGEQMAPSEYSVQTEVKEGKPQLRLYFRPLSLPDGEYQLAVHLGSSLQAEQVSFSLQSTLALADVVNFPNPMKEETRFTFVLQNDRAAEVEIKIYTVAGRLIRSLSTTAQVGYNETAWDGLDGDGDELANGVYFYKVTAKDGGEKTEVIERVVVMK